MSNLASTSRAELIASGWRGREIVQFVGIVIEIEELIGVARRMDEFPGPRRSMYMGAMAPSARYSPQAVRLRIFRARRSSSG